MVPLSCIERPCIERLGLRSRHPNCGTGVGLLKCNLRVEGAAPNPRDAVAPLMRTINNSNWTQYKPDTRVFSAVIYRKSASAKQRCGHPICTVVINNPAANVEEFRLRPIEWSVGWFFPDRPASARYWVVVTR